MKNHALKAHSVEIPNFRNRKGYISDQNRITCQECQAKVTRPQLLRKHMESIHHQCSVCKKLHSTKEDLNTHKTDHVSVIKHLDPHPLFTDDLNEGSVEDYHDNDQVKDKNKDPASVIRCSSSVHRDNHQHYSVITINFDDMNESGGSVVESMDQDERDQYLSDIEDIISENP